MFTSRNDQRGVSMMHPAPSQHNNTRFYIVLITLVVGGIFFLLVMNDSNKQFGLTGSTVGLFDSGNESVTEDDLFVEENPETVQKLRSREVDISLQFDNTPLVNKEATIEHLEAHVKNPKTPIKINENFLELSDPETINLVLEGFSGKLQFDGADVALTGKAQKIKVNGITFSAREKISLVLDDADYSYLAIDEVELVDLTIPEGSGLLNVADKLTYTLEQEGLNFYSFVGKIVIDEQAENLLDMEGVAKGLEVSGSLLNLDVR